MAEQILDDEDAQPDVQDTPAPAEADPSDALRRERDALQDRLLRTAAEFDNYRKRIERERRDFIAFAASELLLEILPIVDNLERALAAAPQSDAESLQAGIELIRKQMLDLLARRGVTPIEALGADFDPNIHEAVAHEPSDQHREGEVMEELRRGYMLNDKLLRPSMVKVARRP